MSTRQGEWFGPQLPLPLSRPRAAARASDPDTSHDAADSVKNLRRSQQYVLALFRTFGQMTDERAWSKHQEVFAVYRTVGLPPVAPVKMSPSGFRSRRSEVVGQGLRDSGRKGLTASGRRATIWECSE